MYRMCSLYSLHMCTLYNVCVFCLTFLRSLSCRVHRNLLHVWVPQGLILQLLAGIKLYRHVYEKILYNIKCVCNKYCQITLRLKSIQIITFLTWRIVSMKGFLSSSDEALGVHQTKNHNVHIIFKWNLYESGHNKVRKKCTLYFNFYRCISYNISQLRLFMFSYMDFWVSCQIGEMSV